MEVKNKTIGFLGLGTMGLPMCQGMVRCGFRMMLPTFRTFRKPEQQKAVQQMLESGALPCASQLEMIQKCDILMLMLPKSQQVEEVVLGEDGILKNARPGTIVIDHTSADPNSTRKLSALLEEKGIEMLDCPVSGGCMGAAAQTLSIMAGGKKEVFEACRPILETVGAPEKVIYVGPSGSGHMIKCANNFLSACCHAATSEAIAVCAKAGIDPHTAVSVINASGGMSASTNMKFPKLVFPDKGMNMSLDLISKDIGLFVSAAQEANVPALFANTTAQAYKIPTAELGPQADWDALTKTYERWAGVKLSGIDKA